MQIRAIRPGYHPFPFLLYGDWTLVAIALGSAFTPGVLPRGGEASILTLLAILVFWALGLWLPVQPLALKLAHIALQLGCIILAARSGSLELRLFPLLQIVLIARSCLLFERWGRLAIASTTFLLFLSMIHHRIDDIGQTLPPRLMRRFAPRLLSLRLNLVAMFLLVVVFLLLFLTSSPA